MTPIEKRAFTRAMRANVRRGFMLEVSPGVWRLTEAGEKYVLSMPVLPRKGRGRGVTKYGRLM